MRSAHHNTSRGSSPRQAQPAHQRTGVQAGNDKKRPALPQPASAAAAGFSTNGKTPLQRSLKRAKTASSTAAVVDVTTAHARVNARQHPVDIADVPSLPTLLDQVAAAATPSSFGCRAEFSWETDPTWARTRAKELVEAAKIEQGKDEERRRVAGETVPRRSRYLDGITLAPDPAATETRFLQWWDDPTTHHPGNRSRRRSSRRQRKQQPEADTEPTIERFVTHQVLDYASVTFSVRDDIDHATREFPHELRIRLEARSTECAVELRYILNEETVSDMSDGVFSMREGGDLGEYNDKTWLQDIPFTLSVPGIEHDKYTKTIGLPLPGLGEDATVTDVNDMEDFLVLRQAIRFYGGSGTLHKGEAWRFAGATMTHSFRKAVQAGGIVSPDGPARLRWLQLTPFGKDAWKADNRTGQLDTFYSSDDDSDSD